MLGSLCLIMTIQVSSLGFSSKTSDESDKETSFSLFPETAGEVKEVCAVCWEFGHLHAQPGAEVPSISFLAQASPLERWQIDVLYRSKQKAEVLCCLSSWEGSRGKGRCCRLCGIWKHRTSFRTLNGLGVGVCVSLGTFWFPQLGKPLIWLDGKRGCVERNALLVLLEPLIPA